MHTTGEVVLDSAQRGNGIRHQDEDDTAGARNDDSSSSPAADCQTLFEENEQEDDVRLQSPSIGQHLREDIETSLDQLQQQARPVNDHDSVPPSAANSFSKVSGERPSFDDLLRLLIAEDLHIKSREQSEKVGGLIKIEYEKRGKCDKDIFNPFKRDLNRFKPAAKQTKACLFGGTSIDGMKYDHRRGHTDTMDAGKNTAKHAMNYKKTYLFLYNLMMFVMFLMVHMILTIKGLTGKIDDESLQGIALLIKLLTYTQLLESIHPILGLVPGGPWMPFLQVIGRLLVNFFLTNPEIRLNSWPYAHYLFIVWSSIEIFRYSFYALRVFNVEIYPITWARYTLFMPLYPMGGFCEAQIVLATVNYYEKMSAYSLELPNSANFSFSLTSFLRFYTFALLGPSIFYLMKYMWSQRRKQLKEKLA